MIIIDYQQLAYATILEHLSSESQTRIDNHSARILVLDTLRANVNKFKRVYGPEIVVAFDDQNYWRKDIFPHYKYKRKKEREKATDFDWDSIVNTMTCLKEEFTKFLPYKVVCVPKCEADDIIGTLTLMYHQREKILIVSGDKDFKQLHIHRNVFQWAPIQKKYIEEKEPLLALKEQIIRGDTGDGIPNFLSPDNSFVDGIRQKSIFDKKVQEWLLLDPTKFCTEETIKNYERNKALIDLREVPLDYQYQIMKAYESAKAATKQDFLLYLTSQRLKPLVEVIDEF